MTWIWNWTWHILATHWLLILDIIIGAAVILLELHHQDKGNP